jgi:hypothetical protein
VPQSIDALPGGAQLSNIPGNCGVLVVSVDDSPKPCTDVGWAIMHPAEKLSLNRLELRCRSLVRCNAPDDERIGLEASPTVVSEAQEVERLRFSCTMPLPVSGSVAPELDQAGLLRMEFQAELCQSFLELLKESHKIVAGLLRRRVAEEKLFTQVA